MDAYDYYGKVLSGEIEPSDQEAAATESEESSGPTSIQDLFIQVGYIFPCNYVVYDRYQFNRTDDFTLTNCTKFSGFG